MSSKETNTTEKTINRNSKQYLRTDTAILQAFLRLMKQKTFEQITVQDILEETPVSKGTFYAHFADKYALAERLLETYLQKQKEIRAEMDHHKNKEHARIAAQAYRDMSDQIYALLRIHTDRVDLLQSVREEYFAEYMASEKTDDSDLKATVYAQIMASFQGYFMEHAMTEDVTTQLNEAIVDVFLHIIKNEDNEKLRKKIMRSLKGY